MQSANLKLVEEIVHKSQGDSATYLQAIPAHDAFLSPF